MILRLAVITARRYPSAVYAVVVCPSACLSVRHSRYCTKIAKHMISPAELWWNLALEYKVFLMLIIDV